MNRLSDFFEEDSEQDYGDFFVVAGDFGAACVTRETAERIEALLDQRDAPAWITFEDRVGSRLRVRTALIRSIGESTPRSVRRTGESIVPVGARKSRIADRGRSSSHFPDHRSTCDPPHPPRVPAASAHAARQAQAVVRGPA